jgi:DNA uptake protein ComE-like DNA-binding protein
MPTPAERRALFFLASLLVLGGSVRAYAALATHSTLSSQESADLDRQIQDVDSARNREKKPARKRRSRRSKGADTATTVNVPPGAATAQTPPAHPNIPELVQLPRSRKPRDSAAANLHVDVDVASAGEIERLPRIGPALATRIVANRDSLGPFGSMQELQRVRGIGPALARILAPHVTFSLQPRPHRVDQPGGRGAVRKPRRSRVRVSDPP